MTAHPIKPGAPAVPLFALTVALALVVLGCGGSGSGENASIGTGGRGGSPAVGGRGGQMQGGSNGGHPGLGTGGIGGHASGIGGAGGQGVATGGNVGAGGTSEGTGGFGGAAPGCRLYIQPLAPATWSVEAGPGVTMRVQGSVYGAAAALTWSWTVTYSGASRKNISTTPVDLPGAPPGTVVEFPVEDSGMYQITASVTGDMRCAMTAQVLMASMSTGISFSFRTTADDFPVQETLVKLSDGPVHTLALSAGQPVSVQPVDSTYGLLLPSYVEISSLNTSFDVEGNTTRTPFATRLLTNQTYDLLVVPDADVAPLLVSLNPSTWLPLTVIDPGVIVGAQMLAADGSPVANARMLLKTGKLPSTVGTSDLTGAMTLFARPGVLSARIVPPDGSGLPVATTMNGDSFPLSLANSMLTMQWPDLPVGTLTVQVRGPDGVTPIGNAQVWMYSSGVPYWAGELDVPGYTTMEMAGSVASSAVTDDDGQATFPPYPAGHYALTVVPPTAAAPAAVTTLAVSLPAAATLQPVTLASKVTLSGMLLPAASAGALMTAVDSGTPATTADPGTPTTGAVVTTRAGADGSFALSIDPDRPYELIIQPSSNTSGLGRAIVKVPAGTRNLGTITLPAGQPFQGTVMAVDSTTLRNVPNAFIQVFCVSSSVGCADPTVSLAEATSLGDGTFSLVLPQAGAVVAPVPQK